MEGEKCGVSDPVPIGYTIYGSTKREYKFLEDYNFILNYNKPADYT